MSILTNANDTKKNKTRLTKSQQTKLNEYSSEIKSLIRTTLESAVRIGQILKDVKDNILPYGEWQEWVDTEFDGNIKHDSAVNWINLAELYEEYSSQYEDGFNRLSLNTLYKLSRSTVDNPVKEAVLQLAEEDEPFNRDELSTVLRVYRKAKMLDAGFTPEVVECLADNELVENPKELRALQKLSKKKREAVAAIIQQGGAQTTKEAVKQLVLPSTSEEPKVEVSYEEIKHTCYNSLIQVPSDSVNLAIVEAPMKSEYVFKEMSALSSELERVLAPSGYCLITVGHKGALYAGNHLEPLKPLHLLCLRRTPGKSRSIVGSNIMSASVMLTYSYKPPYKSPKTMLVDLQTVKESEELIDDGMDEVVTGIENGFDRFMQSLVESGDTVLHMIVSEQSFNIETSLKQSAIDLKASNFVTVKTN